MIRLAAVALLAFALVPAPESLESEAPYHPHFQKRLEARVARDTTITVTYQTVTFDKAGAEKMKPGQAWHLANAHLETSGDLTIGGQEIEAGRYSLKARKAKKGGWELVLDAPSRFSSKISDAAHGLETDFDGKAAMFEHLNIDVQPAGDKKDTTLYLDVRFDAMLARAVIELPEKK